MARKPTQPEPRREPPADEPTPVPDHHFVSAEVAVAAFAGTPHVDFKRFRADLDAVLDQDPEPRGG